MLQYGKLVMLMAALTALLVVMGGYFGGQQGAIIAFVLAGLGNFWAYWKSDQAVLKMYKAKVIERHQAPQLFDMVDRLRRRADLPMPTVAVVPSEQPNAFATGRNPENAVVAVTAGLMQLVNRDELEGVVAHELAHIQHRDMLVSTVAATIAGAITLLSYLVMFFGGRDNNNPIALLAMIIVAPLAATVIRMAISRANEFKADRTAGELTGNPVALASALQKLEAYAQRRPMQVNEAAAQLAIVNPLGSMSRGMMNLMRTHPATEERVAALQEQARGA